MDSNFEKKFVLDVFASLIWTKRYYTCGDFELYTPATAKITAILAACPYVCRDDDDQPYYITLKLDPLEGDYWRKQYEDIIPGYYMNKIHWNSIKVAGSVPDEVVKELLDKAYETVLKSLSKKKQKEILGIG
jgi:predicted DNA-binding protein (MmcQ/YjbR family)